jgi:hypothetical protein
MSPNADGSRRRSPQLLAGMLILALLPATGLAEAASGVGRTGGGPPAALPRIAVVTDDTGSRLEVDGRDFMVFGMNWGYMPIGQNYTYSLWNQPDEIIRAALDREMPLLQNMGVNTIRQNVGIPPRWVAYIYEKYGIFTVLNHTIGRYGLTVDGVWHPVTNYADPRVRSLLKTEMAAVVDEFRDVPGILMYLLGNENNYGLSWSSFEIEALPVGERDVARARYLYSLFGEIIRDIKQRDPGRPVAIANGDVQYIDLIAQECPDLDIFGANVYRGISARDFFQVVHDKLGLPALFTEFGADAFNAIEMREDQAMQARYLLGQWQEIYEQSAGKGKVGNAIGGMIFQWSDGWWKYGQDSRLDIHDTHASWANAGYAEDYRPGENNMNEEWWGITAKGYPDQRGLYDVFPRAAYYALRRAFRLDPYAPTTNLAAIRADFGAIQPMAAVLEARGDAGALRTAILDRVRVSGLRMEFETYSTGAKNTSTPPSEDPQTSLPAFRGFDHLESFYVDVEAKPTDAVLGRMSVNILGNVPQNPIDEIFYENRGRPRTLLDAEGEPLQVESLERVKMYQAEILWDDRWLDLHGFYRTGHLHWQYEGDFFGLYHDAFYGENLDIYNGEAPIGFEIHGKKQLEGAAVAFGPELWWGANPAVFLKYRRSLAGIEWTGIFQNDFTRQAQVTTSIAIPARRTRKASLQMQTRLGPFDFEGGALWSGQPRAGETFQLVSDEVLEGGGPVPPKEIHEDSIKPKDAFGFRGKLIWQKGRWNWYGQGAYMGLVAEAGPTFIPTFTGWELKDSGSGNQVNALSGLAVTLGSWQVGPNFLWQKPIVGPMPNSDRLVGTPGHPRNILDDPFAVRGNRETAAAEVMLTYDPTPATWMWAWDSDLREDASLAASLGFVFRRHETTADAGLYIAEDGTSIYAFPGGTPARDLWDIHGRLVKRFGRTTRMIGHAYYGTAEPNGDDPRLVHRFGVDARIAWPSVALAGYLKLNDYGPYDYHHDHNLTFPVQVMADLAYTLGRPKWFGLPQTQFGVRFTYRTLDRFSNRYQPAGVPVPAEGEKFPKGLPGGREWEIRTYLHFAVQ